MKQVHIVMSTHPNESEYTVHSAHVSEEGAAAAGLILVHNDIEENGEDAQLEVWIETLEVQE